MSALGRSLFIYSNLIKKQNIQNQVFSNLSGFCLHFTVYILLHFLLRITFIEIDKDRFQGNCQAFYTIKKKKYAA